MARLRLLKLAAPFQQLSFRADGVALERLERRLHLPGERAVRSQHAGGLHAGGEHVHRDSHIHGAVFGKAVQFPVEAVAIFRGRGHRGDQPAVRVLQPVEQEQPRAAQRFPVCPQKFEIAGVFVVLPQVAGEPPGA